MKLVVFVSAWEKGYSAQPLVKMAVRRACGIFSSTGFAGVAARLFVQSDHRPDFFSRAPQSHTATNVYSPLAPSNIPPECTPDYLVYSMVFGGGHFGHASKHKDSGKFA
jgi:hypothetical protein